jgi:hopanoid biosynthesis associated protein HpnK
MSRRLIITADDFGMSIEVNEAVEAAHRNGILTCASLVTAGAAAEDAIRRAKRIPTLGVGLHLALFGAPAQHADRHASRIAPDGANLGENPAATGTAIMLFPRVRAGARREIAAQFEAWRRSGLPLGHLDGHWHCHQHPAVLAMALELGRPLGLRAVRVPYEAFALSRRVASGKRTVTRLAQSVSHYPLAVAMRRQIRAAGLRANDWFFGKNDEGAVDSDLLGRLIAELPQGVTEIGLHPAVRRWPGPHSPPPHWDPERELAALTDPALRSAIRAGGVELCRWADLR